MRDAALLGGRHGSGIAAEDLPHVFERFYKTADSTGSGLGLAIARNLVLAHGGEIEAESAAGRGTTIRFTLPLEPNAGRQAQHSAPDPLALSRHLISLSPQSFVGSRNVPSMEKETGGSLT
jgi:hypothetical protein